MKLKLSDKVALAVAARAIHQLPSHLQQKSNARDMINMLRGNSNSTLRDAYILRQAHRMLVGLSEWPTPYENFLDQADQNIKAQCEKVIEEAMVQPLDV